MLSLNRKTDYALVALAGLCAAGGRVSARDLAVRQQLPLPVLRNILKRLTRHGVLSSEQGSQGGYRLARPAAQISVAEVVGAIEGPPKLARCCDAGDGERAECDLIAECPIVAPMRKVHGLVTDVLERLTVADLVTNTIPATVTVGDGADAHAASSGSGSE